MHKSLQKYALPVVALATLALPFAGGWNPAQASGTGTTPANANTQKSIYISRSARAGSGYAIEQATAQPQQTVQPQQTPGTQGIQAFASPAFQNVWNRTDKLVASGQVQRSWYWGPQPNSGALQEDYVEGQGGKRLVQYFDKSRMEINNPAADPNSTFYVTNGLLTVELISGQMQTGNNTFVPRYPADIPLASDTDDATAPTYYSFQGVSNTSAGDHPANSQVGSPVIATINRSGQVGTDSTKTQYPGTNAVYYDQTTHHNVPQAIWDFLNQKGPVYNTANGQTTNAALSDPWYYATGLPISEAYWARVMVAGQMQDVLIQAFERRVVTYTPNGVPGFKVQMGNIGQHYYDWRYNDAGHPSTLPTPASTASVPAATPSVSVTPVASTPVASPTTGSGSATDCSGIPAPQGIVINPNCGPQGTVFTFDVQGLGPNESANVILTDPTGHALTATLPTDASGNIFDQLAYPTDSTDPVGLWNVNAQGTVTHKTAKASFKLQPATAQSLSCTNFPASQNMTITPSNCARPGARFQFVGTGFDPGEQVGYYLTAPDQSVIPSQGNDQFTADGNGNAGPAFVVTSLGYELGVYAVTMEGVSSHKMAVGYFKLTP